MISSKNEIKKKKKCCALKPSAQDTGYRYFDFSDKALLNFPFSIRRTPFYTVVGRYAIVNVQNTGRARPRTLGTRFGSNESRV
jgi:hypothetical protein